MSRPVSFTVLTTVPRVSLLVAIEPNQQSVFPNSFAKKPTQNHGKTNGVKAPDNAFASLLKLELRNHRKN